MLGAGAAVLGGAALGRGVTLRVEEDQKARSARGPLPYYTGAAAAVPEDGAPSRGSCGIHWCGDPAISSVALTFDDGPHPEWTPRVLEVLAEEDVRATFFLLGRAVRAHPTVHAESPGRHEIGNHTFDHQDLARLDRAAASSQIRRCTEAIEDALGVSPRLFRPPYGHLGGASLLAAADAGLSITLWSARMHEVRFTANPEGIVGDAVGQVRGGSILLAHDAGAPDRLITIEHLRGIIRGVKAEGLTFATVSDVLAASG